MAVAAFATRLREAFDEAGLDGQKCEFDEASGQMILHGEVTRVVPVGMLFAHFAACKDEASTYPIAGYMERLLHSKQSWEWSWYAGRQDESWSMLANLKPPAHPDLDLDDDGAPDDEISSNGSGKASSLPQRGVSPPPSSTVCDDEMEIGFSLSVTTEESEAGHREFDTVLDEEMGHFEGGLPEEPMMRKVNSTSSFRKQAVRARRERIRAERREEVVDFLQRNNFAGINVNAPRCRLGFRLLSESVYPLHVAAQKGDAHMVQELLRERADPDKRTSTGRTALDMANAANQFGSHRMVLEILSGRWNTMSFRDLRAISSPRA
ncbi:unnamed protein product [Symbiodinium sp. CCMP2592]|nr:unnamed protein product [Symbiodinium sp. CCMP2592]